jgi:hypothetical protein
MQLSYPLHSHPDFNMSTTTYTFAQIRQTLFVLSLGSIVTIIAIITGSAMTTKYQYYLMLREDD